MTLLSLISCSKLFFTWFFCLALRGIVSLVYLIVFRGSGEMAQGQAVKSEPSVQGTVSHNSNIDLATHSSLVSALWCSFEEHLVVDLA